jgi:hypothetical protein
VKFLSTSALFTVLTLALSGAAQADPILEFTSATPTSPGTAASFGWEFTTGSSPILVTALDAYLDGVYQSSSNVRLYGADGNTIVSSIVTSADTLEGSPYSFYSAAITPTILAANTNYYIVEDIDATGSIYVSAGGITTDPSISFVGSVSATGEGLNPTADLFNGAFNPAFFGPNFNATAVPEPSSLVLCGLAGIAGSVVAWRKRKRRSA